MKLSEIELLGKTMDRKEFIRSVSVGALMLMGGGIIIRALESVVKAGHSSPEETADTPIEGGYGTSAYGGVSIQPKG